MPAQSFYVLRMMDGEVLRAFESIAKELGCGATASVRASVVRQGAAPEFSAKIAELAVSQEMARLVKAGGVAFCVAALDLNHPTPLSASVHLKRLDPDHPATTADRVEVHFADGQRAEIISELLAAVHRAFARWEFVGTLGSSIGEELSEYYARRENDLARLESLAVEVIDRADARRVEIERERKAAFERGREDLQFEREALKQTSTAASIA